MSPLAQRCDQCGSALSAVPFEIGDYVCEKCEAPLPGGSRFCPGCGFAFEHSVPVVESVPLTPGFRPSEPPVVAPPPPVISREPLPAPAAPVIDSVPAPLPPAPKQTRLGLTVAALVVLFGLGFGLSRIVPPPAAPAAAPVVAVPPEADTTDADAPASPPEKEAPQKEETKAAMPAEPAKASPSAKATLPDKPAVEDTDTLSAYASPGSGLDDVPLDIDTLRNSVISPDDLKHKSLRALSLSHNSIYALHGYIFERASMNSYFEAQPWYHPNAAFSSADLSTTEQQNAQTLRAAERSFGYGLTSFDAQGQPYQQRDPLKATAASGSGQNNQMIDLDTLQHRLVTPEDLADKSLAGLSLSYNAIYAAHGYVFQRASLRHAFESTRWYRPNPAFQESNLDSTERANLKTIRAYERTRYGY